MNKLPNILIGPFVLPFIINFFGAVSGLAEGMNEALYYTYCQRFGEKRWHYLVPAAPLACPIGKWLINDDVVYKDQRKASYE